MLVKITHFRPPSIGGIRARPRPFEHRAPPPVVSGPAYDPWCRTLHYVITLPSPRPRSRAALGASTGTKTRCLRPYRPSPIIFRSAMGFVRWEQLSRSQILPLLSTHQKHCFWWSWSWVVGGFGGLWGCLWSTQQPGDLGAMSGRINTPHCRTTHAIFPL